MSKQHAYVCDKCEKTTVNEGYSGLPTYWWEVETVADDGYVSVFHFCSVGCLHLWSKAELRQPDVPLITLTDKH